MVATEKCDISEQSKAGIVEYIHDNIEISRNSSEIRVLVHIPGAKEGDVDANVSMPQEIPTEMNGDIKYFKLPDSTQSGAVEAPNRQYMPGLLDLITRQYGTMLFNFVCPPIEEPYSIKKTVKNGVFDIKIGRIENKLEHS
jgi:hypothetical protein